MRPEQAEEIVRDLYEDRRDKMGYDEILHVEAVVDGVAAYLNDLALLPDAKVVAWLHDTVEDGMLSLRELYEDLNTIQFEALMMISRDGRLTYMNYIRMIRDYPGRIGDILRAVKRADLYHNMSRPCPEHMRGMREPGGRYDRAQKILRSA